MPQKTFHIPLIAHTLPNKDYFFCAHTQKTYNMSNWLTERGHDVRVYGHEDGAKTINCTEYIPTITAREFEQSYGDPLEGNKLLEFSCTQDYAWKLHTLKTSFEMQERVKEDHFILCFYGRCHKAIADAISHVPCHIVEPSVGYMGTFAKYRVFESSAWMHFQRGRMWNRLENWARLSDEEKELSPYDPTTMVHFESPEPQDAVIHSGFDPDNFEISENRGDYYLCVSRVVPNKGIEEAVELSRAKGKKLIVAGPGDFEKELRMPVPSHVECVGRVDIPTRKKLMAEAEAVIAMSRCIETYGFTPIEAMLSGTVPIVRPLGGHKETVINGVTGFHARNYAGALDCLDRLDEIDPETCRKYAIDNFGKDVTMKKYDAYFESLLHHIRNVEASGNVYYETPDFLDESCLYNRSIPITGDSSVVVSPEENEN